MKIKYLCLLPLVALLFSCEDEQEKPVDDRDPGISLFSPATSVKTFANGEKLVISGLVSDNDRLKEVTVKLTAGTEQVMFYQLQPNTGNISLDTSYTFNVTAPSTYTLYIKAEDITLNSHELTREFTVTP